VNCKTHPRKATQAVARLIQKSGGKIEYLRLAKLSYLSDRESLVKRGIPITGGTYFSMNKGPVISEILNFVRQRNAPGWKETISPDRAHILSLEAEPAYDSLSKSELDILDAIVARHAHMTTEELVQWCHDNCAEIVHVPIGRRKGIEIESIFEAEHVPTERITAVVSELESLEKLDALLT
jgi:uncharacterized phage-associated protein